MSPLETRIQLSTKSILVALFTLQTTCRHNKLKIKPDWSVAVNSMMLELKEFETICWLT
jgi:hypothetical protein